MTEKVERLKLKRRGQRAIVTKNRQEANSLLSAELLEPSSVRRLKTVQGLLEGKQAILKELDEEIIESCPLADVEQETVDSEEISEAIVECIEQIKSVIREKTQVDSRATLAARESEHVLARESENVLARDETVRTDKDNESGAPARHPDRGLRRSIIR